MIALHGTTRDRAKQILQHGSIPGSRSLEVKDGGFSMYLEAGPFDFGVPEDYARGKAREFADKGAVLLYLWWTVLTTSFTGL